MPCLGGGGNGRSVKVLEHIVPEIAPRVSGYIVEVAVKDNQFVHKGELLFKIHPSDYQLTVNQAQVQLNQSREGVQALEAASRATEATSSSVTPQSLRHRGRAGKAPCGKKGRCSGNGTSKSGSR